MRQQLRDHMQRHRVFASLDAEQASLVLQSWEPAHCQAGDYIIRQHEPSQGLYLLSEGSCEVFAQSPDGCVRQLAGLCSGDVFGKISLLFRHAATATVRARTEVDLWRMPPHKFKQLTQHVPELEYNIGRLAAERLYRNMLELAEANRRLALTQAELERANRKLERLSQTDELTGLSNRRHFESFLLREIHRAKRLRRAVGLMLVDADKFKQINDRYGHSTGDELIGAIGSCLHAAIREDVDLVARWGGDEFAVVIIEPGPDTLQALAWRALGEIAKVRLLRDGEVIRPSISIGAQCFSGTELDRDYMLDTVDRLLYQAKQLGGNRFRLGEPSKL